MTNNLSNSYIVIEGVDGSGKTTVTNILKERKDLFTKEVKFQKEVNEEVVFIREPGSTLFGEDIRNILLNSTYTLDLKTEIFLFFAARNELLVQNVIPNIEQNKTVISDRCYISTYAYQIHNKVEISLDEFSNLVNICHHKCLPDIIIYLNISYETSLERRKQRELLTNNTNKDNIEAKSNTYYQTVCEGYKTYMQYLKESSTILNAFEKSKTTIYECLLSNGKKQILVEIDANQNLESVSSDTIQALNIILNYKK